MTEEVFIEAEQEFEASVLSNMDNASEFIREQYLYGNLGALPELPEDFILIRDGYRSREPR